MIAGVCGGDGSTCVASLSLGAFDSSGTVEVLCDFGSASTGFQFDVTGLALTGGSGGAAADAGFTVSTGGETVLGFSFTGSSIPAGSGVLTVLSFSDVTGAATELSLGFSGAITDADGVPFSDQSAGGSIAHGDPDCSGGYYGDLVIDDCGVCDGGNADDLGCGCGEAAPSGCDDTCGSTLEDDCAGVCGGSSSLDDCGVCDGGNADQDCAGVCDR